MIKTASKTIGGVVVMLNRSEKEAKLILKINANQNKNIASVVD